MYVLIYFSLHFANRMMILVSSKFSYGFPEAEKSMAELYTSCKKYASHFLTTHACFRLCMRSTTLYSIHKILAKVVALLISLTLICHESVLIVHTILTHMYTHVLNGVPGTTKVVISQFQFCLPYALWWVLCRYMYIRVHKWTEVYIAFLFEQGYTTHSSYSPPEHHAVYEWECFV